MTDRTARELLLAAVNDYADREHDERRHALATALHLPAELAWGELLAAVDRRTEVADANARADIAAARQAEEQAGRTLSLRHRQLCDALGVGPYGTTSWPDLILATRHLRRDLAAELDAAEAVAREAKKLLERRTGTLQARAERAEATLGAVRDYAAARCTDQNDDLASASWVLHILDGDSAHTCPDGEPCPDHDQPAERCCVCGSAAVEYHNHHERPFCWPCADCGCGETPCVRTGTNDPAVSSEADLAAPAPAEPITESPLDALAREAVLTFRRVQAAIGAAMAASRNEYDLAPPSDQR